MIFIVYNTASLIVERRHSITLWTWTVYQQYFFSSGGSVFYVTFECSERGLEMGNFILNMNLFEEAIVGLIHSKFQRSRVKNSPDKDYSTDGF